MLPKEANLWKSWAAKISFATTQEEVHCCRKTLTHGSRKEVMHLRVKVDIFKLVKDKG
jgi:hypothetical protein